MCIRDRLHAGGSGVLHRMRRPARHVKLLVFTAFTLLVLSFVSPLRRKGDDSGEAAGTKAAAFRQQQQKKDGYHVKGSPSIEGKHDAGELLGATINYICLSEELPRSFLSCLWVRLRLPFTPAVAEILMKIKQFAREGNLYKRPLCAIFP